MSVSGVGPTGMDPMGQSQSAQSISVSGIISGVYGQVEGLSHLMPVSDSSESEINFKIGALKGACSVLSNIFSAAGLKGSDVEGFEKALSDVESDPTSSTCDTLQSSIVTLAENEESHPIEMTPQQSLEAFQNCIAQAGTLVEAAVNQSGKVEPDQENPNPNLNEVASILQNLDLFSGVLNLGSDISSSLRSEANSVEQQMGPGQGSRASMSHFASLFSHWSSSLMTDVEKKLG